MFYFKFGCTFKTQISYKYKMCEVHKKLKDEHIE